LELRTTWSWGHNYRQERKKGDDESLVGRGMMRGVKD